MGKAASAIQLLILCCGLAAGQLLPASDRSADRDAILAAIASTSRAYVAREAAPFEQVYLENFVSIRGRPVYNTRAQLVAMMQADALVLAAGKKLDFDTISYESENPRIRFFGHTAIVNIARKNYWQYRGLKCLTRSQATEAWIKREGVWKAAASHQTMMQCAPKPVHPIHPAVAAIRSVSRPPANSDKGLETQLRETIANIVATRTAGETGLEDLITEGFVSTNELGVIAKDTSPLASIPLPSQSRGPAGRADDAIVIYDNAAIFTFKAMPPADAVGGPRQTTIFFVRQGERWKAAAAHTSRYYGD